MLATVPPKVSGVNLVTEMLKVWSVPVGLNNVSVSEVGRPVGTRPKLPDAGSSHVVASAATERFSRPAPCSVGPTSGVPGTASLTTKSAWLTSADLICAGDQSGCSCRSTAAPPGICGVAIEGPVKTRPPERPPGHPAGLPTHVIELRTLTATEAKSGLTAKSTSVG